MYFLIVCLFVFELEAVATDYGSRRTACRNQFFPSTVWVPSHQTWQPVSVPLSHGFLGEDLTQELSVGLNSLCSPV